jgi:non-heme chloroperoxidase
MGTITTKDGTEIYYKDWGKGQPIVFHHGWPLSADDWDNQMMFFLAHGYRVIAHDRRGHGRSTQTFLGNDMDTYAADIAELVTALGLKDAIHIGHSTGGGEVARYVAQHGNGRVAKAALISAIPPVMVKKASNPGGTPIEVFDGYRAALAANRAQFYIDVPAGPFYGFNRPGAKVIQGASDNWWRQGMMGGVKAHYDCIKVFSERPHRGSQKDHRAGAGDAQRRRPDRAVRGRRPLVGQAAQIRHAEGLQGFSAWHADDPCGYHQRGPSDLH